MRTKRVFTPPKMLPVVPRLKAALAEPPTGLPEAQAQPQGQEDGPNKLITPNFIQNYGDWRAAYPQGSVLDFLVWTYLTQTKQWQNHYQFEFKYPIMGGQAHADFYVHVDRIVMQVKGFVYGERRNDALSTAQEALMRKQRFRVVSLYEDDLIYRTDYTIENALTGQQAMGKESPKGVGYAAN
jgi:hypothetical protein